MPKTELPPDLTRTFSDIARTFLDAETVHETLDRTVHLAVETVESCDFAGVSIVQLGGDITTPAASHDKAAECDGLQYQFREGPCVSAIWNQETFESEDLTQERRWPKWTPRAVEVGAASLVSYRLFVKQNTLGALNLYAGKPRAFDDVDRETGIIFAAHAAVALSGARRRERMDGAIVAAKATGMVFG